MVKLAKSVYCSKCGRVGRLERNSNTMRFSYPMDKVHVPDIERIWTISDAWDYAAKVCLHMSQKIMKFPPPPSLDESVATSLYSHFGMVVPPHTSNEIGKFESFHRHIIQDRISASKNSIGNKQGLGEQEKPIDDEIKHHPDYDTLSFETKDEHIHTPLPSDAGRITRSALAFLYGAIVCTVISRHSYDRASVFESSSEEEERIVAKAICTESRLLYVDERMRKYWIDWLQIMLDSLPQEMGIGAARAKHATKLDNGNIVKLSRKQIQKKKAKMEMLTQQINEYLPLFEELFKGYGQYVKSHPQRAASFLLDFLEVQLTIYDQSRTYRYASVIHGNDDKCPVSPYEPLKEVRND
jgi:hypothetical protein